MKLANLEGIILRADRRFAKEKINDMIEKGYSLKGNVPYLFESLTQGPVSDITSWIETTSAILQKLFTTNDAAKYFIEQPTEQMPTKYDKGLLIGWGIRLIAYRLNRLEQIGDMIDFFAVEQSPDLVVSAPAEVSKDLFNISRSVFLIHGRDREALLEVARWLEKCDINPIILSEQTNKGRTIIEKFEHYSGVKFAIAIVTPDDEGRLRGSETELTFRARQNVWFELGFFIGILGRKNVSAIRKGSVDIPSDLQGFVYSSFSEDWKLSLANELVESGIDINWEKAFRSQTPSINGT